MQLWRTYLLISSRKEFGNETGKPLTKKWGAEIWGPNVKVFCPPFFALRFSSVP